MATRLVMVLRDREEGSLVKSAHWLHELAVVEPWWGIAWQGWVGPTESHVHAHLQKQCLMHRWASLAPDELPVQPA